MRFLRHQFADRLQRIVGEADIAIGQDAAKPRRLAARPALDHGNARNPMPAHERERIGQRFVGKNRDRIDDHAAFVALDLAHLLGLFVGLKIAMDDADAAGLRHGDGEPRLGHRIHAPRRRSGCSS